MKSYVAPVIEIVLFDTDTTMGNLPAISKGYFTENGPEFPDIEIGGELPEDADIDAKPGFGFGNWGDFEDEEEY